MYEASRGVDTPVAIKVLRSTDPALRARFALESRVLDGLDDPHIPTTHSLGELPDGSPYIVMEMVAETLAERLERAPLTLPEVLEIARQLLAACDTIHQRGIVHRDIKPSNIGLTRDGCGMSVKLLDFGVCHVTGASPECGELTTRHDMLIGTPEYMAPEQIRTQAVDHRTDLYAVGVVLYECITGRLPFQGECFADVVASILRDPILSPAATREDCTPALERIVLRAMDRAPANRFQTAAGMAATLAIASHGLVRSAAGPGVVLPPSSGERAVADLDTVQPLSHTRRVAAAMSPHFGRAKRLLPSR